VADPAPAPGAGRRRGLIRGTVAGSRAAWLRLGPTQGLPVVVLHGAGLDRAGASWGRVLPALGRQGPVLAPDLPGHGETAPLRDFRDIGDLSRWLAAFLDERGIRRAVLAGVSMGGAIAIRLALDAPGRVAGLVPVASYGLSRKAPLHGIVHAGTRLPLARLADPLVARSSAAAHMALRTLIHDPAQITPDIVEELRRIASNTSAERTFDRFLASEIEPDGFRTVLLDDLPRLTMPTRFLHGRFDATIPIEAARAAAKAAHAPLDEVDAGHWPMFEAPDAAIRAIEAVRADAAT
jgi:pimeloyl-ACP methyl ester carboxylesterase